MRHVLWLLLILAFCTGPTHAETAAHLSGDDTRAVAPQPRSSGMFRRLAEPPAPLFTLTEDRCLHPGDVFVLTGNDLMSYTGYRLVLKADKRFVALNTLSVSREQILLQMPRDTALKPELSYPLMLLSAGGTGISRDAGLTLSLCPAQQVEAPDRSVHEHGEVLVLANSGLVDGIIKEGAKLGYLLLRRHQLNSLNQSLLVLGGSDRNLLQAMRSLSTTFPDAIVDFNHHYFSSAVSALQAHADEDWPLRADCMQAGNAHLRIGMLGGHVDPATPGLASGSVLMHDFLLPDQRPEHDRSTLIARLLTEGSAATASPPVLTVLAASVTQQHDRHIIATVEAVSRAIDWFINEKVALIGVPLASVSDNRIAAAIFNRALQAGQIIFAAAGHQAQRTRHYPAALPGIIAIGTVNGDDGSSPPQGAADYIDFAAPGPAAGALPVSYAVGVAALHLLHRQDRDRATLYAAMQRNAQDMGVPGRDARYGWGRIRVGSDTCPP